MPGQRAGARLELLDRGVERRRRAVAERSGPDGHRGAVLDLRPCPITPPAPHPISPSGRRISCTASSTSSGAAEHAAGGEHDDEVAALVAELGGGGRGGVQRGRARLGQRREAGADADGHAWVTILAAVQVIAVFGPTGVGKTAVAIALAERLRSGGRTRSRSPPTRMQLYAGLPILTGAADAHEQAQLEHRLLGFVPDRRDVLGGRVRPPGPRGDRRADRRRAGARSSSAAPASTCGPRSPTSTCDRRWTPRIRERDRRARPGRAARRAARRT